MHGKLSCYGSSQDMYQYGTNGNTSHYLQVVMSKLQVQKSNKETEYRWNVQQNREERPHHSMRAVSPSQKRC